MHWTLTETLYQKVVAVSSGHGKIAPKVGVSLPQSVFLKICAGYISPSKSFVSVSKYSHANEVSSKDRVSKRGRVQLPADRLNGIGADGC